VSDNHLSTNPRAWKEASTLAQNGYDVTIITVFSNENLIVRDNELLDRMPKGIKYVPVVDFTNISFFRKVLYKGVSKLALILKKVNIDSVYLLCSVPNTIVNKALEINADLYICHIDCSLYVGKKLIGHKKKVAFDFEDWYSKDYLVSTRPVKLLANLERFALEHGTYVSCPSKAMSRALYEEYNISKPAVLYNGFPIESMHTISEKTNVSLVWFSQTIGAGRGLEKIIQALSLIQTSVTLHLIGDISKEYKESLERCFIICKRHQLVISPQVKHHQLHGLLTGHSVGLALEDIFPTNKNKTVSNKILQYLQAGLLVLATNTDGQNEIAENFPEAVSVADVNNIQDWKQKLESLIAKSDVVNRKEIVIKFNELYSWQSQEQTLLTLVKNSFIG
jgi:glycosyltransferase involved in cell wall biosynthesis